MSETQTEARENPDHKHTPDRIPLKEAPIYESLLSFASAGAVAYIGTLSYRYSVEFLETEQGIFFHLMNPFESWRVELYASLLDMVAMLVAVVFAAAAIPLTPYLFAAGCYILYHNLRESDTSKNEP